jgi:hypothetical protein
MYLDFWGRCDTWPQSHSWLDALSGSAVTMLDSAYAALEMRRKAGLDEIDSAMVGGDSSLRSE